MSAIMFAGVQEFFRRCERESPKTSSFHQAMQSIPDQLVIVDNGNHFRLLLFCLVG